MASLKVVQLRETLSARSLDSAGLKAVLVSRLQVALDEEGTRATAEASATKTKQSKPPSKSPFAIKTFQTRRDGKSFKESRLMSAKKLAEKGTSGKQANVPQDGVFDLDLEQEFEEGCSQPKLPFEAEVDATSESEISANSSDDQDDREDTATSELVEEDATCVTTCNTSKFDEEVTKYKPENRRKSYGDKSAPINIVLSRNSRTSEYSGKSIHRWKSMHAISER
jgi:hypothetical protein